MALLSVPCPKCGFPSAPPPPPLPSSSNYRITNPSLVSFPNASIPHSISCGTLRHTVRRISVTRLQAHNGEVAIKESPSSSVSKSAASSNEGSSLPVIPDAASINAFMTQVSDLVKLVDSRDIVELELKQQDCELLIRKKEAIPLPPAPAPPAAPQPSYYAAPPPPQASPAPAAAPSPPPPAPSKPAALRPPIKASASSHPPLKCPMAGTFYRCPGPGEPPFVKVGDKVQKGQVICIIEAMKLVNEIEADQSGTIAEILVEDGKPVSMDMSLFIIVP